MTKESDGFVLWVADLRVLPPPEPFRAPTCMPGKPGKPGRKWRRCCDYHRADWVAISHLVVTTMGQTFGAEPVPFDIASPVIEGRIEQILSGRRRALTRGFAFSLLMFPMYATDVGWVDGQTRAQAMLDAGVDLTLFAD